MRCQGEGGRNGGKGAHPFVRETRLIVKQAKEAVEEVRVRHAEGITHLAYLHGFEDARVRELLEHLARMKGGDRVRIDILNRSS